MKIFLLPDLGEGLPDAEIREWYVKEGDEVKVDQPMVAMETAKAVVDVPAPRAGRIAKLHGKAGDVINTGAPLVEFVDGDEQPTAKATVVGNLQIGDTVIEEPAIGIKPKTAVTAGAVVKAIPAVRALAKRLNVDISAIAGTGPNGQITVSDVEKAAKPAAATVSNQHISPLAEGGETLRGVRRAMAMTMAQSHSEVVPVILVDDADIHTWPKGTDITVRTIRALIAGCKAEPALNAWFDGKAMVRYLHQDVHLGLAVDSADGLFVPVIKNASQQSAEQLRATVNRFKTQVNDRSIPQDELKGATLVLSNVGIFAGRYASPIIVPPTVAIIATGKIRDEVVAVDGNPAVHRLMPLSLSFDHRAVTGGEAARFLTAVIQDLQLAE